MTNQNQTGYELLSRGEREAIDNMRSKGFAVCVVSPQDLTDSRKSLDDMEMMLQKVALKAIRGGRRLLAVETAATINWSQTGVKYTGTTNCGVMFEIQPHRSDFFLNWLMVRKVKKHSRWRRIGFDLTVDAAKERAVRVTTNIAKTKVRMKS